MPKPIIHRVAGLPDTRGSHRVYTHAVVVFTTPDYMGAHRMPDAVHIARSYAAPNYRYYAEVAAGTKPAYGAKNRDEALELIARFPTVGLYADHLEAEARERFTNLKLEHGVVSWHQTEASARKAANTKRSSGFYERVEVVPVLRDVDPFKAPAFDNRHED